VRRLRSWPAARFGAFTQGILRFNTYLGLAAIGSLHGQPGLVLAALLLALMVPAVNVLSVWSLSTDRAVSLGGLLLPILKNPLILACLAGMAINLLGIGLPGGSDRLLGLLAAASLPLAGFVLTLCGAASWALSNVVVRRIVAAGYKPDMLGLVVWSSLMPIVPFFALSGLFEAERIVWVQVATPQSLFAIARK